MSKEEQISLIPYEETLYSILIGNIKGKYFQNISNPLRIAQIPPGNNINMHYVEKGKLSAWFPLDKYWGDIALEEFRNYALISDKQFEKYKKTKKDLSRVVLAEKGAPIFDKKGKK